MSNMRANIRNHITFPRTELGSFFNTIYPLNLVTKIVDGRVNVFLLDWNDDSIIDEADAGSVDSNIKQLQASIREVGAKMIEKTRFYRAEA